MKRGVKFLSVVSVALLLCVAPLTDALAKGGGGGAGGGRGKRRGKW